MAGITSVIVAADAPPPVCVMRRRLKLNRQEFYNCRFR